jgi:hypothetical protein
MRAPISVALGLMIALIVGCATTQARTDAVAARLERSAEALAVTVCTQPDSSCATGRTVLAAREFAQQAHEFRLVLDSAGDPAVVSAYKRLWHSYHTLLDQIDDSDDPHLPSELQPAKQAFDAVQIHVKNGYSYADPDLYASGGYYLDPYYN